jgi:3-deoxy-manno-octulosonate cytidylyltransferase (CMP-KDO synthetase)
MTTIAVIPARFESTRFPGKPLLNQTGKYLVQHVYEQVTMSCVDRVIVATDDQRIRKAVESFGGECAMTSPDHRSGTDRVAEVARTEHADIFINVQGDEPEIEPAAIDKLVSLIQDSRFSMATLACSFADVQRQGIDADPSDPNCVKVVCGNGRALYFSRSLIPHPRHSGIENAGPLLHLGIYAYTAPLLLELSSLSATPLERSESLEQLRALESGHDIAVGIVERAAVGIDTPEDYAAFVKRRAQSRPRL